MREGMKKVVREDIRIWVRGEKMADEERIVKAIEGFCRSRGYYKRDESKRYKVIIPYGITKEQRAVTTCKMTDDEAQKFRAEQEQKQTGTILMDVLPKISKKKKKKGKKRVSSMVKTGGQQ